MINIFELKPGMRVRLLSGDEGIVTENMEDGMWVMVEVEGHEPELAHAQDIADMIE